MCKQCEKNPVYEFTNQRKLCRLCFIKYFHKKVLYIIRKFKMIKNGDVISYVVEGTRGCTLKNIQKNIFTKGNFRDVVLEEVLKMFSEKAMVGIVKSSSHQPIPKPPTPKKRPIKRTLKINDKITKIAVSNTIDLESDKIIHMLFKGNVKNLKEEGPVQGKVIKPLYLFLDKEVLLYAKLRKLKFRKEKPKRDKISGFVDDLEKKHPEIKRAIVNSYLELY